MLIKLCALHVSYAHTYYTGFITLKLVHQFTPNTKTIVMYNKNKTFVVFMNVCYTDVNKRGLKKIASVNLIIIHTVHVGPLLPVKTHP